VLIGFQSEEDWFDYRLENDSRFLQRSKGREKIYKPVAALRSRM
jgi:hypothetical protein